MSGINSGTILKQARTDRKVSQRELARRAGTSQSYVSRVEAGEVIPSLESLNTLLHSIGNKLDINVIPSAASVAKGWA